MRHKPRFSLEKELQKYQSLAKGLVVRNPIHLAIPFVASSLPLLPVSLHGQCMGNDPAVNHALGSVSIDVNGGGADFKFRFGASYYGMNTGLYMTILNGTVGTVNGGSVLAVPNGADISQNGGYFGVNGTPAASFQNVMYAGFLRLNNFGSGNIPIRIGGTLGFINLAVSGGSPPNTATIGQFGLDSNGGGVTAGDCASLGALPVELTYFRSVHRGETIKLEWQTATETNNAGFEVERSEDGKNFRSLAWVEGHGTTLEKQEYLFDDKNLRAGRTYYYRLKQVDFDGTFEYSKIISVTLKGGQDVVGEFYPNPAKEFANVNINSEKGGTWTAQIFDATGKAVRNEQRNLMDGQTQWQLGISGLAQGLYFVKFTNGNEQHYRKLKVDNF